MNCLEGIKPKRVFYYFSRLADIPHGSGNLEKISEYLYNTGLSLNCQTIRDEFNNVIIIKDASSGYENEPAIILQGHMDMVAVSDNGTDMKTTPLNLQVDDDGKYVFASHTSLGGDDGIAIAIMLAILEDKSLKHPRLEMVMTTDEETGMDGAREIDLSMLKGRRLLNLDSEDEGIFLAGCAGGFRGSSTFILPSKEIEGNKIHIRVAGLKGGHSGTEIDKKRGNANKILAGLLEMLEKRYKIYLIDINGGAADNVIPSSAEATIVVEGLKEEDIDSVVKMINEYTLLVRKAYENTDDGLLICDTYEGRYKGRAALAKEAVTYLGRVRDGVVCYSPYVDDLVQTSLNLGVISFSEDALGNYYLKATHCVRSSVTSEKYDLRDELEALCKSHGGDFVMKGDYPGWEYKDESFFRDKMVRIFSDMYGSKPLVTAIHAGLECGLLHEKIGDLDCVSIGPDMKDIHTANEMLSIESTRRVYEYVLRVLETKD